MSETIPGLPAGEAREDEREIERAADKLQDTEAVPMRVREPAVVPLTATTESGESKPVAAPDGSALQARGEVITTLAAEEARHEEMRKLKPCMSCAQAYQPRKGSDEYASRAAHLAMAKRYHIAHEMEAPEEYFACRACSIVGVKWVHASQTCPADKPFMHTYRKGWLSFLKAFVARRRAEARMVVKP